MIWSHLIRGLFCSGRKPEVLDCFGVRKYFVTTGVNELGFNAQPTWEYHLTELSSALRWKALWEKWQSDFSWSWKCSFPPYSKKKIKSLNNLLSVDPYLMGDYSILFYPVTLEGRRGTTDEFAWLEVSVPHWALALVLALLAVKVLN